MVNLEDSSVSIPIFKMIGVQNQAALTLCEWEEIIPQNPQTVSKFSLFFNVYDQLNNPVYIRQISQLVN